MSKIIRYECDVCNKEFKKFNISFYKKCGLISALNGNNKMYHRKFQICESCEELMFKYIKNQNK